MREQHLLTGIIMTKSIQAFFTSLCDYAMICKRGGFVIQRHNELRDLEAEILLMVCNGVEIEPVLQDITGEELNRRANTAPDARLDIVARGFWESCRGRLFSM